MVFYRPVVTAMTTLIDPEPPMLPGAKVALKNHAIKSWPEVMSVLSTTLPEGSLQSYSPMNGENAVMTFRKRMPEEWHTFGRSFILIDPYSAEVVQLIDARKQHTGMRMIEKIYPLHSSRVGGLSFKVVAIIAAMSLVMVSVFGLTSHISRYRK